MNVLLICPEFPDTFWSFKHAIRFLRKKASLPPLGLLTVAAMLPSDWRLKLVDANVTRLTDEHLAWADYAFVTGMIVQRASARHIIERCKRQGLEVIAGGPLFTSEHDEFEQVDHFVINEAEELLPEWLADLERGEAKSIYTTCDFPDIRDTPSPRWDLAELDKYASMSIQFSRGCPFNCEFCNVTALLGHRPRTKSPEQILRELDALYDLGWRGRVFFVDDNLIGNKRELKKNLLPALIEWRRDRPEIEFYTEASINLADDRDLMGMMVQAGFDTVFIGIETPDEESLVECSKKQNANRDLVGDVKRIQRAGLQVQAGFIIGFDNDGPSIFQRQIDFIQQSGIATAMVSMLQAPPGTRLHARMKKEKRLLGPMSGDNVDGTTNIVPRMDLRILREGYENIVKHIYSPEFFYARVRTFLREYQPPRTRLRFTWAHLLAFGRTAYRVGLLEKERFHFWKLLLWTLFRRPRLIPMAVTLATNGYHLRQVSEIHGIC